MVREKFQNFIFSRYLFFPVKYPCIYLLGLWITQYSVYRYIHNEICKVLYLITLLMLTDSSFFSLSTIDCGNWKNWMKFYWSLSHLTICSPYAGNDVTNQESNAKISKGKAFKSLNCKFVGNFIFFLGGVGMYIMLLENAIIQLIWELGFF